MVEYHPISAKDMSRLHQFGPKVLPGIVLGCVLYAGRIWKGDILVADIEELEQMGASEFDARRLNAKEVLTPMKKGDNFIFSIADGTVKISGGDQVLRTSTLILGCVRNTGEEQDSSSRRNRRVFFNAHDQDSLWYDGEAKNDCSSI